MAPWPVGNPYYEALVLRAHRGSKAGLHPESPPPPSWGSSPIMDLCSVPPAKKGPNMSFYNFFFKFSCISFCISFSPCLPQADCSAASKMGFRVSWSSWCQGIPSHKPPALANSPPTLFQGVKPAVKGQLRVRQADEKQVGGYAILIPLETCPE